MTLFSKLLDDQEIAALAAYYQQLGASAPHPGVKE
jgi:cytochrome c553